MFNIKLTQNKTKETNNLNPPERRSRALNSRSSEVTVGDFD